MPPPPKDPRRRPPPTEPTVRGTPAYDPTVISPKPAGRAPTASIDRALPPEAAQADPSARFGKFIRTKKLGAGGMGEVWKAYDTELARWVALKFLKGGDDEEIARFLREAQTAGRLSHPNIAAIFDIGQNQGRHWIAMQFVPGQTLKTLPRRDRRGLVRLVRDAARALEYAHVEGVIHRDVKPDNLMVVRTEKGEARLFVMDFGLARPAEGASDLSMSGLVVGTPAYMAPEQARGERVDARADVWSLGATLYELLADRVPFRGPNVLETLKMVQEADPKPLRSIDPKIGREVETIVMKCLEKDPVRRYQSAAELADDLDRFLAGEAIQAHPPSLGYRVRKAFLRRKALVATGAVSAAVLAVVVAVLGGSLTRTSARLSGAQEEVLRQMRTISQISFDAAVLKRRVKDRDGMRQYLDQVRRECGKVIELIPQLAEPHYRLGRMHRALGDDESALEEQYRALAKEPGYAPALYERLVIYGRRYRRRVEECHDQDLARRGREWFVNQGGESRPGGAVAVRSRAESAREDSEAAHLRGEMDRDLATIRKAVGTAELSAAEKACAEGWRAWAAGELTAAKAHFERALAARGAYEEVFEALAEVECDLSPGESGLQRAVDRVTQGLVKEPGLPLFLSIRGQMRLRGGLLAMQAGRDPEAWFTPAIADFSEASALEPKVPLHRRLRAQARTYLGRHRSGLGEDPSGLFTEAVEDLDNVLRSRPDFGKAFLDRGLVRSDWGNHRLRRGEDPSQQYDLAIRDLTDAIAREPGRADAWRGRAGVRGNLAGVREDQGEDPTSLYREAVRDLDEALKLDPADPDTWITRGSIRANWAVDAGRRGREAGDLFEASDRDFTEALRLAPKDDLILNARGHNRTGWFEHYMVRKRAWESMFQDAVGDFAEAIRINADRVTHWERRGYLYDRLMRSRMETNQDPTEAYESAVRDLTRAHQLNPGIDAPLIRMAGVKSNYGVHLRSIGKDPEPLMEAALQDLALALKADRAKAATWKLRGMLFWNLASVRYGKKRPCLKAFEESVRCLEEALALDPGLERGILPMLQEARQAVADNQPR